MSVAYAKLPKKNSVQKNWHAKAMASNSCWTSNQKIVVRGQIPGQRKVFLANRNDLNKIGQL